MVRYYLGLPFGTYVYRLRELHSRHTLQRHSYRALRCLLRVAEALEHPDSPHISAAHPTAYREEGGRTTATVGATGRSVGYPQLYMNAPDRKASKTERRNSRVARSKCPSMVGPWGSRAYG